MKDIQDEDIKNLGLWLNTKPENIFLEKKEESIYIFQKQIKEMIASYENLPKEKKRTEKIIKLLKNGEKPYSVYVEKNDENKFILEGRHRIVAFWLMGYKNVDVQYVEKKYDEKEHIEKAMQFYLQEIDFDPLKFKEYLWKCDLEMKNYVGTTPIMFLLDANKSLKIDVETDKIFELIQKVDINKQNIMGYNTIMFLLENNQKEEIDLENTKIFQLLEKSNLNLYDSDGFSVMDKILLNNKSENLQLNNEQIFTLFQKSNKKTQNKTIKNILFNNLEEYIDLFLYEKKYKITKNIMDFFHQKKLEKEINIIEKRNQWLDLQKLPSKKIAKNLKI